VRPGRTQVGFGVTDHSRAAVRDLTTMAVRAWFSGLDATKATRNGHAYAILNMICNTAVNDGLLERNPCQVTGAMNPKPKKKVKVATTVELHNIADKLGADENYARFRALLLLAGWCGLRFGECLSRGARILTRSALQ
jgi:integrase